MSLGPSISRAVVLRFSILTHDSDFDSDYDADLYGGVAIRVVLTTRNRAEPPAEPQKQAHLNQKSQVTVQKLPQIHF